MDRPARGAEAKLSAERDCDTELCAGEGQDAVAGTLASEERVPSHTHGAGSSIANKGACYHSLVSARLTLLHARPHTRRAPAVQKHCSPRNFR
jgi:hypothetical protein